MQNSIDRFPKFKAFLWTLKSRNIVAQKFNNEKSEDYLQYEWIEINKIDEYPIVPQIIKKVLQEGNLPVHKINNDLL